LLLSCRFCFRLVAAGLVATARFLFAYFIRNGALQARVCGGDMSSAFGGPWRWCSTSAGAGAGPTGH
jgi:hypothetical protein